MILQPEKVYHRLPHHDGDKYSPPSHDRDEFSPPSHDMSEYRSQPVHDMAKTLSASARCDESTMREFDKNDIHKFRNLTRVIFTNSGKSDNYFMLNHNRRFSKSLFQLVSAFLKIAKCNIWLLQVMASSLLKKLVSAFLGIPKCNIGCFKLWHFASVLISKRAFHISRN